MRERECGGEGVGWGVGSRSPSSPMRKEIFARESPACRCLIRCVSENGNEMCLLSPFCKWLDVRVRERDGILIHNPTFIFLFFFLFFFSTGLPSTLPSLICAVVFAQARGKRRFDHTGGFLNGFGRPARARLSQFLFKATFRMV